MPGTEPDVVDIGVNQTYSFFFMKLTYWKIIDKRLAISNLDYSFPSHHHHHPSPQCQKMQTILLAKYVL